MLIWKLKKMMRMTLKTVAFFSSLSIVIVFESMYILSNLWTQRSEFYSFFNIGFEKWWQMVIKRMNFIKFLGYGRDALILQSTMLIRSYNWYKFLFCFYKWFNFFFIKQFVLDHMMKSGMFDDCVFLEMASGSLLDILKLEPCRRDEEETFSR